MAAILVAADDLRESGGGVCEYRVRLSAGSPSSLEHVDIQFKIERILHFICSPCCDNVIRFLRTSDTWRRAREDAVRFFPSSIFANQKENRVLIKEMARALLIFLRAIGAAVQGAPVGGDIDNWTPLPKHIERLRLSRAHSLPSSDNNEYRVGGGDDELTRRRNAPAIAPTIAPITTPPRHGFMSRLFRVSVPADATLHSPPGMDPILIRPSHPQPPPRQNHQHLSSSIIDADADREPRPGMTARRSRSLDTDTQTTNAAETTTRREINNRYRQDLFASDRDESPARSAYGSDDDEDEPSQQQQQQRTVDARRNIRNYYKWRSITRGY